MGLAKANRLRGRHKFDSVYQKGIRRKGVYLNLTALHELTHSKPPQEQLPCLGISISRKVAKLAVVRNRIKRRIRAAFRQLLPEINHGWSIIITVRTQALECEYEHFLRELKKLLIQAEIIDGH